MTAEAYPLQWPQGWPRTKRPEPARFSTTFARARDSLFEELRLMGARNIVLSTNIELRRDGLPYANQRQPEDTGIAVYFQYKSRSMTFACDRWKRTEDNVQAIRKTIEALRGIERWGASDMMERAFTGFQALPDQSGDEWWIVLGISPDAHETTVEQAYKSKRRLAHPDAGGSNEEFHRIQRAWEQYQEGRG